MTPALFEMCAFVKRCLYIKIACLGMFFPASISCLQAFCRVGG